MVRAVGREREPSLEEELEEDYVDESHIQAFAEALQTDDVVAELGEDSTRPSSPLLATHHHGPRVRKVSALSDFAPVNLKVKRRKRRDKPNEKRQDWLFLLVRWPLLMFIFLFIGAEFGLYVLIRQAVNAKEWASAWRGRKGIYRKRLRAATTYTEWRDAAQILDEYLGFDDWKIIDEDTYYDWRLVKKVLRTIKSLRQKNDVRGVLGVLETCVRTNFAGLESARLYSETYLGTKNLIEAYITEVELSLIYIRESTELSNDEKRRFFKSANTHLGVSALCLSGGASFGYYHFGVVRAFVDTSLLPRVVTGTSAGGLVAALVCTRTDVELKRLIVPELANRLTACEEPFRVWFKRFWTVGARFDSVKWARKACFFTRGSLTFREAYMRTGRILNVSVIPADRHSPTKLLNYLTAPDTVIWSALIASAAVPGILNPVVLMQKLKDGRIVPWNWGSKFKDGSLRVDIPLQALNLYFNVTHPVVSQVNPHVHLFFFAPRGSAGKPVAHRKGKGWRGNFLLSAAEQWLKLELTKNFKFIRDLELLPQLLGQDWSSVFLQRFDGTVTIWPRTRVKDWLHILSDPDPAELARMIQVGQSVTWPKLHMIENRYRLERRILEGRQAVRRSTQSSNAVPVPVTGTRLPEVSITALLSQDAPLSVDTDAETAFANGNERFFKRSHLRSSPQASGRSTPRDSALDSKDDPLRSPAKRRKWASKMLDNGQTGKGLVDMAHSATPDPPPPPSPISPNGKQATSLSSSSSFLQRLRTTSLSSFAVPFSSLRRKGSTASVNSYDYDRDAPAHDETNWSSDTSSDDNVLPLNPRRNSWQRSMRRVGNNCETDFVGQGDTLDAQGYEEDIEGYFSPTA